MASFQHTHIGFQSLFAILLPRRGELHEGQDWISKPRYLPSRPRFSLEWLVL